MDLGLVYMDGKLRHRNLSCNPNNVQCSTHISSSRSPNELILILLES
jgi:hypothetical protein